MCATSVFFLMTSKSNVKYVCVCVRASADDDDDDDHPRKKQCFGSSAESRKVVIEI